MAIDPGARISSYERALRQIADQLYRAVPGVSGDGTDNPLRRVLQSIKNSGEQTGISYFAYSFISAKRWASERATICPLIERLGSELASASVDNFRFLVVVGRAEIRPGVLQWLLALTSSNIELGKKEGGPSPGDFEGRPIWYRLPDLTPVERLDFDAWASLLSTAWGVEAERARQSVLESFSDKSTSFLQASDGLVKFVLPKLWPQALPNLK